MRSGIDAIVVGSGFGGAVVAARLAQAGMRVTVLERGRRWRAGEFPRRPALDDGWLWQVDGGLYDIRWLEAASSYRVLHDDRGAPRDELRRREHDGGPQAS